jgi:hypothetical protein
VQEKTHGGIVVANVGLCHGRQRSYNRAT